MGIQYIADTLAKHPYKTYKKRHLSQVTRIVVHHFAGNISVDDAAKLHVQGNGWPGIGYHAVIDFDGQIYITNSFDTIAYNVRRGNTPTLGIALRGDFSKVYPDEQQIYSLKSLILLLRGILGDLPVYCHSDLVNTDCPGKNLRKIVKRTYGDIQALKSDNWVDKIRMFFLERNQGDEG